MTEHKLVRTPELDRYNGVDEDGWEKRMAYKCSVCGYVIHTSLYDGISYNNRDLYVLDCDQIIIRQVHDM